MNARDWAFLGCRIIALIYALSALVQLPISLLAVIQLGTHRVETEPFLRLLEVSPLVSIAIKLGIAAALFYAAGFFSKWFTLRPDAASNAPDSRQVLRVGTFLVVLYFALSYVPPFLGSSFELFIDRTKIDAAGLAANAIGVLIVLAALLSTWLSLRNCETEPESRP